MNRQFTKNGQIYVFDSEKFCKEYNNRGGRGDKTAFQRLLVKRTERDFDTVKKWTSGKSSPGDLKTITIIEEVLSLEEDALLKSVTIDAETITTKENVMITEKQREIAHGLYGELCDMIYSVTDSIGKMDFDPNDPTTDLPRKEEPKYANLEDYRNDLILKIRKTGIYLSADLREKAINMVHRAFGPWDAGYNDMFYNGDEYREYLESNDWKDEPRVRYTFSMNFREMMYKELNEMFKDYSC